MTEAHGTAGTAAVEKSSGRRVGTFTLGVVLVFGGGAMLASLFWPGLHIEWVLRLTPCVLIFLGAEVLLAARGGRKVKYDWLGMFLCLVLTLFAVALYGAAWWMLEGPGIPVYNGSWHGDDDGLTAHYTYFNDVRSHWMELAEGDKLSIACENQEGRLNVEIYSIEDGETIFDRELTSEKGIQVEIPTTGGYYIELFGRGASGRASFTRIPGPNAAELDAPEETDPWWKGYSGPPEETEDESPPEEAAPPEAGSVEPLMETPPEPNP